MGKPATLKVDIVSDSRQARDDLDSFSSKVAGFTAGVTASVASFALDKITDFAVTAGRSLTDGIDKAASPSAALGTLNYNYGAASETIAKFAEGAANTLGLSKLAAVEAANRFSVYAKAIQLSGTEAAGFATQLTKLAGDLGAFADLPTEDAINAIGSAFRGERDPLEKYGVLLNDANVKAAYFRRTGEEVNGTLTTQQNILGTLQVLQEKGIEIGDAFARESEQLGNKQQVLSAQFDNVKTKIGSVLLPAFADVTSFLSDSVVPGVEDVVDAFRQGGFSGAFDEIANKWGDAWPKIETRLRELFDNVTTWIGDHVPSWDGWLDGIQTAWDGLLEWLSQEIPKLSDKVSTWLRENLPKVGPWIEAFGSWLDKVINGDPESGEPGLLKRLDTFLNSIATWIEENQPTLQYYGTLVSGGIMAGFAYIGLMLTSVLVRALVDLKSKVILEGVPLMAELGLRLAKAMGDALNNWILNNFSGTFGKVLKGLVAAALNAVVPGLGSYFVAFTPDSPTNGSNLVGGGPIASAEGVNINISVEAGFGTNGADVGAAIVAEIQDYINRTGSFPIYGLP